MHKPRAAFAFVRHPTAPSLCLQVNHTASGGLWSLPGGKVEPGEFAPYTARRELAEETGIAAYNLRRMHSGQGRDMPLIVFEVLEWSGLVPEVGPEGEPVQWGPIADLVPFFGEAFVEGLR